MNEAQFNLKLRRRSIQSHYGESSLSFIDSATMRSYQYPSKASAVVFCRRSPKSFGCPQKPGYDPEMPNIPSSSLKVAKSRVADNAGRGVFTLVDIPANAYIALESLVNFVTFEDKTVEIQEGLFSNKVIEATSGDVLDAYMHGYGYFVKDAVSFGFSCFSNSFQWNA